MNKNKKELSIHDAPTDPSQEEEAGLLSTLPKKLKVGVKEKKEKEKTEITEESYELNNSLKRNLSDLDLTEEDLANKTVKKYKAQRAEILLVNLTVKIQPQRMKIFLMKWILMTTYTAPLTLVKLKNLLTLAVIVKINYIKK